MKEILHSREPYKAEHIKDQKLLKTANRHEASMPAGGNPRMPQIEVRREEDGGSSFLISFNHDD